MDEMSWDCVVDIEFLVQVSMDEVSTECVVDIEF